ncbi:MAG: sirohydrochlorin cobaltochelatase [Bacteroidales bacterium]|nr:sirohydrochlorin cobaltochelatase [Bacteroidales bacterium]
MKQIVFILALIFMAVTVSAKKQALLMVHFGTTYDDTRATTIDALNSAAVAAFPEMKVVEAYTSRLVIKRLAARGIEKPTPRQALLSLAAEGYTDVFIQSSNVIDGVEMDALRKEAEAMVPFFDDIRVGEPLLYTLDDCHRVVEILAGRYGSDLDARQSVVLVGHGTAIPANAIYSQIDYMFTAEGHPQFHVATVEGYPTLQTTVERLKAAKAKSVRLVPFMFVAGDHARNDIDGDWRSELEGMGYRVSTVIEGLGQIPEIRELYLDHIRRGLTEKPLAPSERKAEFLKNNL